MLHEEKGKKEGESELGAGLLEILYKWGGRMQGGEASLGDLQLVELEGQGTEVSANGGAPR